MREPPGWHARGYLPHFDNGASLQASTYRLADALPADAVARFEEQSLDDERRRAEIERWLDAGHGACVLREPANAACVVENWQHFHGMRYWLHAWVVMPNHVHVLIEPIGGAEIAIIVQSWKSCTAKRILGSAGGSPAQENAGQRPALPRKRVFWQPDYWDRFIRNERHYRATIDYIHANPVKARLVARAADWPWTSAAKISTP